MSSVAWGDLQHFVAVAEGGSVAAAAKRLAVNHSTVLRRLVRLEAALGSRLFDRLPGGYALTAAGNHLAERLEGLNAQVESTQRQLRGLERAIEGHVRIACAGRWVEDWLLPRLARFRQRHPAVRLQLLIDAPEAARESADLRVDDEGGSRPLLRVHPDARHAARVLALQQFLV